MGERLCGVNGRFEEVQIKHYIQNQEQLDGKGSDEDGEF